MSDEIHTSIDGKLMNKEVTISGVALDAKAGAVVKLSEGEIVYLEKMDFWDDTLLNTNVQVKGLLTERKMIPDPQIAKDGAISTGAYGTQLVLVNAKIIQKK